jgi:hypothetical protein
MSDETTNPPGLAGLLARSVHDAGEQAIDGQKRAVGTLFGGLQPSTVGTQLGCLTELGTFKSRVQRGGRVTIPDAERDALGIEEGDIVQTIVVKIDDSDSHE